jgi:hypothetical protein
MTDGRWAMKTCLVTLTVGCTMGGWALLARHDGTQLLPPEYRPAVGAHGGVVSALDLPPLSALGLPASDEAYGPEDSQRAVPAMPAVSLPTVLPPIPMVSAPTRTLRPIARTRSSR